jgi:hypothetical protein
MTSPSETLDEFIALTLTRAIASTGQGQQITVSAPATWSLCVALAERGLAYSDSSGVAAKQIGPYRLAMKDDGAENLNTVIETIIPIAVSYAAAEAVGGTAYYIAALSFAFRVLSATCASSCLIKNADEWDVLLFIKSQNQASPPVQPTIDDIRRHFLERSAQSLPGAAVDAAVDNLKTKRPIWGSSEVDLIKETHGGGYVALA